MEDVALYEWAVVIKDTIPRSRQARSVGDGRVICQTSETSKSQLFEVFHQSYIFLITCTVSCKRIPEFPKNLS